MKTLTLITGLLVSSLLFAQTKDVYWGSLNGVTFDRQNFDLEKTTQLDQWGDAGAFSKNVLYSPTTGSVSLTVDFGSTGQNKCFGFSTSNTDDHYNTINYGFLFENGDVHIVEDGFQADFLGAYSNDEVYLIERNGSTIYYKVDGLVVRTKSVGAVDLYVDASLYSKTASFSNVKCSFFAEKEIVFDANQLKFPLEITVQRDSLPDTIINPDSTIALPLDYDMDNPGFSIELAASYGYDAQRVEFVTDPDGYINSTEAYGINANGLKYSIDYDPQLLVVDANTVGFNSFLSTTESDYTPQIQMHLDAGLVFSPDNDGNYDTFYVQNLPAHSSFQLDVLDNTQTVVFTSTSSATTWDGKYLGTIVPKGLYSFQLTIDGLMQHGVFVINY